MQRTIFNSLVACTLIASACHSAFAGEFFEKNGVALQGYDPVSYFTADGPPRKGDAAHQTTYRGSVFYFADEADRGLFLKTPAKYAPQFGGFCAFGTAQGFKVSAQPDAYVLVDGKLYVNYDRKVLGFFKDDLKGNIAKAEKNWPEVSTMELKQ